MKIPEKLAGIPDVTLAQMCRHYDRSGDFCLAHLAEGRCLSCPVISGSWHIANEELTNRCQDWQEGE